MGRRWQCEWQHSEEELFQAYRQATTPHPLLRLQALWHLRWGGGALIGVTYRLVQTWVTWYRQGGLAEVMRHAPGGSGVPAWLTAEQRLALNGQADPGGVSDAMGRDLVDS